MQQEMNISVHIVEKKKFTVKTILFGYLILILYYARLSDSNTGMVQ